jgi:hypothetical protein
MRIGSVDRELEYVPGTEKLEHVAAVEAELAAQHPLRDDQADGGVRIVSQWRLAPTACHVDELAATSVASLLPFVLWDFST